MQVRRQVSMCGVAGRGTLSFYFPLAPNQQTWLLWLKGRWGRDWRLSFSRGGELEENTDPERRGTDLRAIAIDQIRSKEHLNKPVNARMNCETQIWNFFFNPLSATAVKRMHGLFFLLPSFPSWKIATYGLSHGPLGRALLCSVGI